MSIISALNNQFQRNMDIQKLKRTTQIKRLSAKLYQGLSFMRYLLMLGWPAIVLVAYLGEGELALGDAPVIIQNMNPSLRWLLFALMCAGLFSMQKINSHLRLQAFEFSQGRIFTREIVEHARGLLIGVAYYVVAGFGIRLISVYQNNLAISDVLFLFSGKSIVVALLLGILFTLMWTFEIGEELNQESTFTI